MIEVLTEEGWKGVGECSDIPSLSGVPEEVRIVSKYLRAVDLVKHWEVLEQELWQRSEESSNPACRFMQRTVVGGVVSAICDIVAQVEGLPMWEWLGGEAVTEISLYANINRAPVDRVPSEFARFAVMAVEDGFSTVKLAPFDGPALAGRSLAETGVEHVRAVRESVGDEMGILVDVHHMLSKDELASVLSDLEDLKIGWLEDAVDVLKADQLNWLAESTPLALAGGEHLIDPDAVTRVLAGGHLDYLLVDPKHFGGPLRVRKLLDHLRDVQITYHNPTGPVATALSVHLNTLHPNCTILEYVYGEEVDRGAFTDPPEERRNGAIPLPMNPGLGLRLSLPSGCGESSPRSG